MSAPKVGDDFPEGVSFTYIPYAPENDDVVACGLPVKYDASKEFKTRKVVLVAVPGAFTPTCQERHVVSYIQKWPELKEKGVDHVVFIAYNDHWVMGAWGKANGVKDDSILFMSDTGLAFSKSIGWYNGDRALRYAIVVDNGKVLYAEKDVPKSVAITDADAVLPKL